MSESENVQVVQDLYAAFGRGDMDGIFAVLDEEIDWTFNGRSSDIPFGGHFRGHDGMLKFFGTVAQTCEVLEFGPQEVMSFGNHVLSLGHERVKARSTGKQFESDWAHLFTIRAGKIVRLREYYDTAAIAEAFLEG